MTQLTEESTPPRPATLTSPSPWLDVHKFTQTLLRRQSWFIAFLIFDGLIIFSLATDPVLIDTWSFIAPGISLTIQITLWAFVISTVIGLFTALARISRNIVIYNIATFLCRDFFAGCRCW